jgi:hypothetical protein
MVKSSDLHRLRPGASPLLPLDYSSSLVRLLCAAESQVFVRFVVHPLLLFVAIVACSAIFLPRSGQDRGASEGGGRSVLHPSVLSYPATTDRQILADVHVVAADISYFRRLSLWFASSRSLCLVFLERSESWLSALRFCEVP